MDCSTIGVDETLEAAALAEQAGHRGMDAPISGGMVGTAEAFNLGAKLGMDPKKLFEVISTSTGQSWSVTTNSPVPGTVASAPSGHGFEPGAKPRQAHTPGSMRCSTRSRRMK